MTFTEGVMRPEDKAYVLLGAIVCGGSGNCGLIQEIVHNLDAFLQDRHVANKPIIEVRQRLQVLCHNVVKVWSEQTISIHGDDAYSRTPVAQLLFVGWLQGKARIIEISPNCATEQHEQRGYAAIGSGAAYAHMTLFSHWQQIYPLEFSKQVVWRAMQESIQSAPAGLAPPICMWQLMVHTEAADTPSVSRVSEAEMGKIEDAVDHWRTAELEAAAALGIRGVHTEPLR